MATEILYGPITGPYWADDGDIIIVSDDAVVRSDAYNSGAIENRSSVDDGISIIVDGKINNSGEYGDGIRLVGESPVGGDIADGNNLVQVRQGGSINGFHGINLIWGQNSNVVVQGRVMAELFGINIESGSASIDISGTVKSDNSALVMLSGTGSMVTNSGRMISDLGTIFIQDTDSLVFTNSGVVRGVSGGITYVDGKDLSLLNTGVIKTKLAARQSGDDTYFNIAVDLPDATGFLLDNQGRIESGIGIQMSSSSGTIDNSGNIIGLKLGLQIAALGYEPDEQVTILNSGLIRAETSLYAYYGKIDVTNSGVMAGDIATKDAQVDMINSGKIAGVVRLGNLDDSYRATGNGFVTRFVDGGDGQDRLFGANFADDLRGGAGNDNLRGKAGEDRLKGGAGDDILKGGAKTDELHGGAGRDLLIGGAGKDILWGNGGADVFQFGANSKSDTVMDFQNGKDILRLDGQSGGFASLIITDLGPDLSIAHDGGIILLSGEAGTILTAADFAFV